MNRVILIGNLTRDPELRTTASGVSVCNFSIAVNRRFKNAQTGQQETDYFNVIAWRQLGELCSRYLAKGRKVAVVGSIQTRSYEANDGSKRTAVDIVADEVEFLSAKGSAEQEGTKAAQTANAPVSPGGEAASYTSGFTQVDDDELPF